jgi:hypothetical protein
VTVRQLTIECDGQIVAVDPLWVDRVREGSSSLGWFALDRSPLAFLRKRERALFCGVLLARYLPEAVPLAEILERLP